MLTAVRGPEDLAHVCRVPNRAASGLGITLGRRAYENRNVEGTRSRAALAP